jgi:hypothetical protein
LDSFTETPLKSTRDSLNKKYKNLEFFSLYSLKVKAGQEVRASLEIKEKPKRITAAVLFQPVEDGPQFVKMVGSGYFQPNFKIEVEGVIPPFSEAIVVFIADATKNADHLSENVKSLFDGEFSDIQVTDFGTDWTMSDVEVTFATSSQTGKPKQETTIVLEEEVKKLYSPQWLMTVRLDIQK